ncbi:hypothetical protein B7463_g5277, partial [Scytalidium lignicola]
MVTAEASTAESTRSCFDQFGLCINKLDGAVKTHIGNRHADFKLWADSVGAVAQGEASLDWRFHDRPSDIFLIKGLLSMLEGFLKACVSATDNEDSVQEHLSKVDSIVQNLVLVGVAIRRSGRKSRLQKADASFHRDRDKYLDLRAHLTSVITSKPTEGPRDIDKDTRSFDYFAKLELDPIQDRLVEANLRRRHRFMEAQRHSDLLKGPTTFDHPQRLKFAAHILASGSAQPTQDDSKGQVSKMTSKKKEPKPGVARTVSDTLTTPGTTASAPETGFKGLQQKGPAGSTVTKITAITAGAQYPKAKASNTDQLSFKCPCCCQAIPVREAEESQFRKHLAYDLCPYTCILDNCPTPYKLFVTEKEWNEHFMNAHPPRWRYHTDDVSDDELTDVLSESVIHVMGITKCPLCDSDGPPDSPELVEHVLEHIHDFSLRSLPWPTDPVLNLNKPVGTFNASLNDVDYIAQWIDETSPEEERLPQLCALDHNPPANTEERSLKESAKNYFTQNDYFLSESSDGRFLSTSELSSDVTDHTRSKVSSPLYFYESQPVSLSTSRAGSDYLEDLYHSRASPSDAVSPTDDLPNDIGALDEVDVGSKDAYRQKQFTWSNIKEESVRVDPLGLILAHDCENPIANLIFVHGLGGSSKETWSYNRDVTNFWLPWLAKEVGFSNTRIFTFGYKPSFAEGTTNLSIFNFAKDLLIQTQMYQNEDKEDSVPIGAHPIIFVAHSTGGLVVKQAYIIGKANNQFANMIISFYETLMTRAGITETMIVEKGSAVLGFPGEISKPLDADHHGLTKFKDREDKNYLAIRNALRSFVQKIRELSIPQSSLPAENEHDTAIKLLLAKDGVDFNLKKNNVRTLLSLAAENGHEAVVKLLLAKDQIDVNFKDNNGRTPLSLAVIRGYKAIVKLLLTKDEVDINSQDKYGQTPFSLAAEYGHVAVVKLLLANDSVDINTKDYNGRTPMSWAIAKKHEAVVKLLVARGAVR